MYRLEAVEELFKIAAWVVIDEATDDNLAVQHGTGRCVGKTEQAAVNGTGPRAEAGLLLLVSGDQRRGNEDEAGGGASGRRR